MLVQRQEPRPFLKPELRLQKSGAHASRKKELTFALECIKVLQKGATSRVVPVPLFASELQLRKKRVKQVQSALDLICCTVVDGPALRLAGCGFDSPLGGISISQGFFFEHH